MKMKFDKSKVYTALNADELKVGSKVIAANTLGDLKSRVERNGTLIQLGRINTEEYQCRFTCDDGIDYAFAYLVEEPKRLNWTDLKIGDVLRSPSMIEYLVIGIDRNKSKDTHIYASGIWLTDAQLKYWEKVE